ncbi:Rsc8 protein [Saccharomycopsis crataegensis]|uniref:Rsc8 protein n=1 Tax=Saccharomycopsis crataegensis TaxID=43959 RepID=A0AAV5QTA4_9ASCO|nr:Rsc8 protein [Saccharomycopsis crataegensis]
MSDSAAETPEVEMKDIKEDLEEEEEIPQTEEQEEVSMAEDDAAENNDVEDDKHENNEGKNDEDKNDEDDKVVDLGEISKSIEEKARQFLAKQTRPVIIPSFAAWFDLNKVHEIEKRSLPEFFTNGSRFKTESIYKNYRDFMVNTYRLNPIEYLTVTACRRNLAGDVASIIRVHAFLEQWGIINYQIDPRTKPSLPGPQFTGHFQVSLDTPMGIQPFIPLDPTEKVIKKSTGSAYAQLGSDDSTQEKNKDDGGLSIPLNLEIRKDIFDSSEDALLLREKERLQLTNNGNKIYICSTCGNDSTEVRYHNLRSKASICVSCFESGHFPSNFHAADFIKMIHKKTLTNTGGWSEQETLLLLEGIEMFNEDWDKVANHVATRNKRQCIAKFLQLPIEDKYLNKNISKKLLKGPKIVSKGDSIFKHKETDAVLHTISFLLDKLDPELAATTTKTLQEELLKKNLNINEMSKSSDSTIMGEADEEIMKAAKAAFGVMNSNSIFEQLKELKQQQKILNQIAALQLKKVDLKLKSLNQYEKIIHNEKTELENEKKKLLMDRLSFRRQSSMVKDKVTNAIQLVAGTNGEVSQETIAKSNSLLTEAMDEVKKPSRVVVLDNVQEAGGEIDAIDNDAGVEDDDDDDSKENSAIDAKMNPLSLDKPQLFTVWES